MKKLSKRTIERIRNNPELKRELQDHFLISEPTLYRWLRINNERLTNFTCLQLLAIKLDVKDYNDLLEGGAK